MKLLIHRPFDILFLWTCASKDTTMGVAVGKSTLPYSHRLQSMCLHKIIHLSLTPFNIMVCGLNVIMLEKLRHHHLILRVGAAGNHMIGIGFSQRVCSHVHINSQCFSCSLEHPPHPINAHRLIWLYRIWKQPNIQTIKIKSIKQI